MSHKRIMEEEQEVEHHLARVSDYIAMRNHHQAIAHAQYVAHAAVALAAEIARTKPRKAKKDKP